MLLIFAFAEDFSALVKDFSKSGLKVYVMNVKDSNSSIQCSIMQASVCERDLPLL